LVSFADKVIGVIGAAATGRAAAPVLRRAGARVRVYDSRPAESLGDAPNLLAAWAELRVGDPTYPGIEECDVVIPSPGVPRNAPVLQAVAARGIPILSEIEIAYRMSRGPIVAVTGTNGKTTTVFMIHAILEKAGFTARVAGNALAGGFQVPLICAAETAQPSDWIVAEISSFQLEWVAGFRPRVAVITNITADHLDRHGTVESYAAAKGRLLESQKPDDWTILNRDNPAAFGLSKHTRGHLLTFGHQPVSTEGAWTDASQNPARLAARMGDTEHLLCAVSDLKVPGSHSVENAMAAACAGLAAGATPRSISEALAQFDGVPDRLESLGQVGGVEYVNNTMCTNVDAVVRSVEAFERPVVLIAGGKGKGLDFSPLGPVIARRTKALVTIGEEGPTIADVARASGFDRISHAASMREAVRLAARASCAGDVVLLAPGCASFDWYRSFEARGEDFKAEVRLLAAEAGG
jgi:UDP-N-acetylmuramoylalanine--D-glutamate ligase